MIFYEIVRDDKNFREVDYADGTDWEGIVCSKDDGHQRAGNRIGDMVIELSSEKIGDFQWTFLSEWLITDKVVKILNDNNITGFKLKKVKISNMELPFKLWEFLITGNGGKAHKDSGIYLKEECEDCGKIKYSAFENGIIVDEKNWDGSDIFNVVGYPRYILVTQEVKDLIEKNNLLGVKFIPSHELKWPEGVIKP